jgi:hypothetical protein
MERIGMTGRAAAELACSAKRIVGKQKNEPKRRLTEKENE